VRLFAKQVQGGGVPTQGTLATLNALGLVATDQGFVAWCSDWVGGARLVVWNGTGFEDPSAAKLSQATSGTFAASTDCIAVVNDRHFTFTTAGAGAAWAAFAVGAENAAGILRWTCGTAATNRCSIASPNLTIIQPNKGLARVQARFRLVQLSSAATTYVIRVGFLDSITAESADFVGARYTHTVNGGSWQGVARNNNAETISNSTLAAVANQWVYVSAQINSGTSATVTIRQGATEQTQTLTTNIPFATGREVGYTAFTCNVRWAPLRQPRWMLIT
jgi:hypothetical protein